MDFIYTRDDCLNLEKSLRCEWLETNGRGGYASSTILNCHTRKYHGFLVAPLPEYNKKFVLLSKVDVSLHIGSKSFELGTNKYPGVFHPTGHQYIDMHRSEWYPYTRYRIGDLQIDQSLLMPKGENTVLIKYRVLAATKQAKLRLHPLLAYREMHSLSHDNVNLRVKTYPHNGHFKIAPYDGMPPMYLDTTGKNKFYPGPYWQHNIEYLKERSRGFDYQEDLFCPGIIECTLNTDDTVLFRASLKEPDTKIEDLWQKELENRQHRWEKYSQYPLPVRQLKSKAYHFLVRNPQEQRSVVAGYPWFLEWGRDAMIALPGLTFYNDTIPCGLDVLKTFASREKDGLIPNYLSINGKEDAFNSIDASLWFFWTIQEYYKKTGDLDSIRDHLLPAMKNILSAFVSGKITLVTINNDGLIKAGNKDTQLTWMDATVHGQPVTPRYGYAVELNALWYNALCFYKEICQSLNADPGFDAGCLADKCKTSFSKVFWIEDLGYLADCVNNTGTDAAIRPNQIFAASLPYSPLTLDQKRKVVTCVEEHLLTPLGLRTLSPKNPKYCSVYSGPPEKRDEAYHQGTVWPWLIGHYTEARLKISENTEDTKNVLLDKFSPLFSTHLREYCVGGISEIFNGNPPHTPKGCTDQAWSVGEVIRTYALLTGEAEIHTHENEVQL